MKPFNIKRALAGDPVITREGISVKIGSYNPNALRYHRVIGWIGSQSRSWNEDGSYDIGGMNSQFDLFMAHKIVRREGWINVYPTSKNEYIYHSQELANTSAGSSRIACVHIEYEFEED